MSPFPEPRRLIVPIADARARVAVTVGQQVQARQVLAKPQAGPGLHTHAPRAGRVVAITQAATARCMEIPAIVIDTVNTSDSGSAMPEEAGGASTRQKATELDPCTADHLATLADKAGIPEFTGNATGFGRKLRQAADRRVDDLIVNGMIAEPVLTARGVMLREQLTTVVAAAEWLRTALGSRRVWLAVDRADRGLVRAARAVTGSTPVRLAALPNKYPQAAPILLTWAIAGRAVPPGLLPLDVGVLVVASEAVAALGEYVLHGRAMCERVVTVAGPAVERPGHYRIPLGTSFHEVLTCVGLRRQVIRVVDGGIMTGSAVDSLDTVVTAETEAILAVDHEHDQVPAPGPCVRCGWCQDTCPVGLNPQALLDCFERNDLPRARRLVPAACLECGLCSYVCPAELPLAEAILALKRRVARNGQQPVPPLPTAGATVEGGHVDA